MRIIVILGMMVCACGGDDAGFECSMASREGTYLLTYTEHSGGSCGPMDGGIVHVDPSAMGVTSPSGATTCQGSEPPDTSADECDFSSSVVCTDAAGFVLEATGITSQQSLDLMTGTVSVTIRDAGTAQVLCSSTYDVEYVRQ